MESKHNPYTYALRNKINGKWYYGVKYSKDADPNTFFINYFTSSKDVKADIELYGVDSFEYEIRKIFKIDKYESRQHAINSAIEWEHNVLRRMRVTYRADCYNKHICRGIVVMAGELNPSKRLEVRIKLSDIAKNRSEEVLSKIGASGSKTKLTKSILKILKNTKTPIIKKSAYKRYSRYANFIQKHRPELVRIIKYFDNLSETCRQIPKKSPVRTKPGKPRSAETCKKISSSKRGRCHYIHTETGKRTTFFEHDDVPEGWVRGFHSENTKEKLRIVSSEKQHSQDAKKKMSLKRAKTMYFTNPELTEYKQYSNIEDVPEGWIRGIKLKTRNDKISKNNRWSK